MALDIDPQPTDEEMAAILVAYEACGLARQRPPSPSRRLAGVSPAGPGRAAGYGGWR